jgi:2-haloacid dehalogenase
MLDFGQFECLTFDCYGTLIDWETGILGAIRPVLSTHGIAVGDEEILAMYGRFEAAAEAGARRLYRAILEDVVQSFAREYGFTASATEFQCLVQSLPTWQPFPDTIDSLHQLHTRFKLAIISNVDNDLFAATAQLLKTPFDAVVTAEEAGSYKPSHRNFQLALEKLALPKGKVLHVAQSLFHDIAATRELGIHSVWVNRRGIRSGAGATERSQAVPDIEIPDLRSLVELTGIAV